MESDCLRNNYHFTQYGLYYGHILYIGHLQHGLVRYHPIIVTSYSRTSTIGIIETRITVCDAHQCIIGTHNDDVIAVVFTPILVGIGTIFVCGDMWYDIYGNDYDTTIFRSIIFYHRTFLIHH